MISGFQKLAKSVLGRICHLRPLISTASFCLIQTLSGVYVIMGKKDFILVFVLTTMALKLRGVFYIDPWHKREKEGDLTQSYDNKRPKKTTVAHLRTMNE